MNSEIRVIPIICFVHFGLAIDIMILKAAILAMLSHWINCCKPDENWEWWFSKWQVVFWLCGNVSMNDGIALGRESWQERTAGCDFFTSSKPQHADRKLFNSKQFAELKLCNLTQHLHKSSHLDLTGDRQRHLLTCQQWLQLFAASLEIMLQLALPWRCCSPCGGFGCAYKALGVAHQWTKLLGRDLHRHRGADGAWTWTGHPSWKMYVPWRWPEYVSPCFTHVCKAVLDFCRHILTAEVVQPR